MAVPLSAPPRRHQIPERTNNVAAYKGFAQWLFFGGAGGIADNDPEEQEPMSKDKDVVANAGICQPVVAQSRIPAELLAEGFPVHREDGAALRPYRMPHLKRFGDYVIALGTHPQPLTDIELSLSL